MLDGVSLDQLRTFIAAVDEGSFSAAGRKLRRAQSAVSDMVGALESQIGVMLFDRSKRYPRLTAAGALVLVDARGVVSGVDALKARAKGMASGLEPELSVVVDVFFPMTTITETAKRFKQQFPQTPLKLFVEALGGTCQPVLDGRCSLGVVGTLPVIPSSLATERLGAIAMVMVASREHPLAAHQGPIPKAELAKHVQLVLTDRTELSAGREFGVMSADTWRLTDMFAKHAFLLNGLGWGGMPLHAVEQDIANGALVVLSVEDLPPKGMNLPMSAIYPADSPPGPAGRWLIERLKERPGTRERTAQPGAITVAAESGQR